jgi:N-methylhydantoinase B/oxoprolinase/acetone carboxylase alpha subunit
LTVDHHGRTAGKATLLVRAVDEILGTHNAKAPRRRESAGRAGQPFRHPVLTHPWRRPSAGPAVDTPMRGCDSVTVAAGDLFVIETPGGGGYGAPPGSGAPGGGPV